ncbi:MAG: hypothetical protein Q9191_001206 [Dirinaria sp. TL-2023a]
MGKSKIVRDSDEESGADSDAGGEHTISPSSLRDLSLSPIINLEYSSAPEGPSTGSTELSNHATLECHSPPPEPMSNDSGFDLNIKAVSSQPSGSTSNSKTTRRRATTAFEEPNAKRPLKTYRSKARQHTAEFDRHSDDEGNFEPSRKSKRKNGVRPTCDEKGNDAEDWPQTEDSAAKRVEVMLQEYHAVKDDCTTSIASFDSAPLLDTSIHNTTYAGIPKVARTQEPHSQPSTVPTLPTISDVTSANVTPATAAKSSASNEQYGIVQDMEQSLQSIKAVAEQELSKSSTNKRSRAVFENDSNEAHDIRPSVKIAQSGTSVQPPDDSINAREESAEGHDELACCVSQTSASAGQHRLAHVSEQSQATALLHADELGLDEPIVGLPKEQYQPRPSRSRSQRNDEELMIPSDFSKRPEIAAKKKGSKRRKTTALAKPSPKVEVDDEADSVSPSFSNLEKWDHDTEPIAKRFEGGVELKDQASDAAQKAWSIVAVEVPQKSNPPIHEKTAQQAPSSSPQKKKKKRGRPRKQSAETDTEESTAQAVRNDPEEKPSTLQECTKGGGTQQQQTTRKKRKADPAPPTILEDSASDTDDRPQSQPLSDHGPDIPLSQSEGNKNNNSNRPNKRRTIDEKEVTTITTSTAEQHRSPPSSTTTTNKLTTPPKTPQKETPATITTNTGEKGPDKHSPLTSGKVAYRVGLSKRARIAPLLKIVKK